MDLAKFLGVLVDVVWRARRKAAILQGWAYILWDILRTSWARSTSP